MMDYDFQRKYKMEQEMIDDPCKGCAREFCCHQHYGRKPSKSPPKAKIDSGECVDSQTLKKGLRNG